jgi:serine/threonine-protein kinase
VPAGGGQPEVLTTPAEGEDHQYPRVLPGGRGVVFTIVTRQPFATRVAILDLGTGQWRTLIASASQAEYVDSGHLIYQLGGALWAAAFDRTILEVAGDPVAVIEDITRDTAAANLAVSRQGTLVYAPSPFINDNDRALVWVDRQGREQPIGVPLRRYSFARLSPDGSRIAVSVNEGRTRQFGIWTWDVSVQEPTRLGDAFATFLAWSADSRYLVYNSGPQGQTVSSLSRRAVDGTGAATVLTAADQPTRVTAISSDGKSLVFEQQTPALSYDLMLLSLADLATGSGARTEPLLDSSSDERNASLSPDGRWMAFESNKSGQFQVYVKPFPNVGAADYQVSNDGGRTPAWSPDGRELFFVSRSSLMAAKVQTTPVFKTGASTRLFASGSLILDARLALGNTGRTYDVSRDGQRFLLIKDASAGDPTRPSIIVVQNWFQELQAKVTGK